MNSSIIEKPRHTNMNINLSTDLNSIMFSSNRFKSFINLTSATNFSLIKLQNKNLCSSMISSSKKKMNKSKTNQLKRIKQAISNKLKKLQPKRSIHSDENLASPNQAKLVKFNYKSYFVQPDIVIPTKTTTVPIRVDTNNCCSSKCSCLASDGEQSFGSYTSSDSNDIQSDLFLFNNSETTFKCGDDLRTTSTPNKKMFTMMNQTVSYHDQSTQIQVDSPVLLESTFNTSSCSHLSDDLIILQTGIVPVSNTADILDNRQIPKWALGAQLNLAVVNQHYFNHDAASGIFN